MNIYLLKFDKSTLPLVDVVVLVLESFLFFSFLTFSFVVFDADFPPTFTKALLRFVATIKVRRIQG